VINIMAHYQSIFLSNSIVETYDDLRYIPDSILNRCAELVVNQALSCSPSERRILDAGSGSGRYALPAMRAAEKFGGPWTLLTVDMSEHMTKELMQQYKRAGISENVKLVPLVADLREKLPVEPESVAAAYTVATFHILDRWREATNNVIETLASGASFIVIKENNQFMHQTEGFSRDSDFPYLDSTLSAFMRYYHQLRSQHGCLYEPSEVRYSDMSPLLNYIEESGLEKLAIKVPEGSLKWQKPHTYADILHCFRNRHMTTWGSELDEEVRQPIADALEGWVADEQLDINKTFYLPAELIPHVFVKKG
jgi:SAM-dependent methyltransferase